MSDDPVPTVGLVGRSDQFPVIEFDMLKKSLFFPLSSMGYFTCHCLLYPFTFIRTRLQMQQQNMLYRGMFHAFRVVTAEEGFRALYRGVFIKAGQVFSGIFYIATYESVRWRLADLSFLTLTASQRSFIGGSCASAVGQTMVVPIDVISQHLMVLRSDSSPKRRTVSLTPLRLSDAEMRTAWTRSWGVVKAIRREYGIRGFYQGYLISLCTFVPNSGLWWAFYNRYCELIYKISQSFSDQMPPRLVVQVVSAPLAGMTSACIMNPVDITRVRMQVDGTPFRTTVADLWRKEGLAAWKKGLSARLTQSCFYSFWLTLCYEPVKWYCLKDEYKDSIKVW